MTRSARRRRRRWLVVIGLAVVLLLGTAYAVLRVKFEGEDLGNNIASILNKRMRGRIEIGSIEWPAGALKKVISGGWVAVTVRDIRVWDDCALSAAASGPEADALRVGDPNEDCTPDDRPDPDASSRRKPRKLLLRTDLITAEIDIHALILGNHDFVFRNLWIHGGEALIEETVEPYPLHAYDRVIVSIITAFYPRMKAGFRAGIYADSAPPVFDLRDIHIKGLNLTVHMRPYRLKDVEQIGYGFAARLETVDVDAGPDLRNDAYLYMDPTDPLVAKFYVRLAITAKHGNVRILDEGPRNAFRLPFAGATPTPQSYPPKGRKAMYELSLTDIKLNRLAQLPTEWAKHDFVAKSLELDLEARTVPCATELVPSPNVADGAALHITGELNNYWDRPYDGSWNLKLDANNLGPTISTCIKSKISGDDVSGTITLTGPFVASPRIGLDFKNIDFAIPLRATEEPLRLTLAEVHGGIDLVNEQGFIDKTKALIRGGKEPGEIELSATFGLKPYNANAQIDIVKAIDVARFLPASVSGPVGKYLKGRLVARGDVETGFALEDFDLSLGQTPTDKSIRVHKGRLFTENDFDTIQIENVYVDAGKSHALFDGFVDVLHEVMDITIDGNFPDLGVWLKRFGMPPLVASANGSVIRLRGKLTAPTIDIRTELAGLPCIDKLRLVDAQVTGEPGAQTLDIRKMTSQGLGGEMLGNGQIRIGSTTLIERLHLAGKRIEAGKLCGLGAIAKGTLETMEVDFARTPIDKNRSALDWLDYAQVFAKADRLSIMGDAYSRVAVCVNRKDDGVCRPRTTYLDDDDLAQCTEAKKRAGTCLVATATRDAGGVFDATITKLPANRSNPRQPVPPRIGGSIGVDLPLAVLDQFIGKRILGGDTHLALHLGGTPTAPQAAGNLQLLRAWVVDAFVGDSQIRVEPTTLAGGKPGVAFRGNALADRLTISGTMGTTAPFPVELTVSGRRIELDVAKDLTKLVKLSEPLQAWVSGTITVKTELMPVKPIEPEAWVELTELVAIVNHRGADGRITPLRLSVIDQKPGARAAVSMRVTPTSVELACRNPAAVGGREPCSTQIATPAGVVEISGHASPASVAILAGGTLDLSLIAPLLDTRFDHASGHVKLSASVSGTIAKPSYEASIDLDPDGLWKTRPKDANPIRLRPVGGDTVLEAPTGLIKLANGSLGFTDVILQVRDQHIHEKGELHVKGNIALDGLTPVNWSVLISGKLAGQMLLVAVPGLVSQAGGLATIDGDLILSGKGALPLISGTLLFDPPADAADTPTQKPRSISLFPRGVRRELAFTRGSIDIETVTAGDHRTYTLAINDLQGSIDGEGSLSGINGRVELRDGVLTSLRLALDADNIPFKVPGTLDLVLSARNVSIDKSGESSNLEVRGNVSIIDGQYLRNFELTDRITSLGSTAPPSRPFWEEYPTLGNADLHLTLDVRRFQVKNNIAPFIDLVGPLIEITNTPRDPRLSGSIRVQRGEFRIPGTRAAFTKTSGSVDFAENQKAGDPQINVISEADYRDLSGQEHLITLTITGSLANPQWDLKTSTGYNKSQTLSLLVLGRNQESLRRSLGDQSLGADPTRVDPSTNPSQGFADQIVKDLAGDWVSGLLGDSLEKFSGLDVFRIEIGFGSIGLKIEKQVRENVQLLGDAEQTIRGSTINVRGVLTTPLKLKVGDTGLQLQGGYLNKSFSDPAEEDISDANLKLVYRLFIP